MTTHTVIRLEFYRSSRPATRRWRWRTISGNNGQRTGRSGQPYRDRADAVDNAATLLALPKLPNLVRSMAVTGSGTGQILRADGVRFDITVDGVS